MYGLTKILKYTVKSQKTVSRVLTNGGSIGNNMQKIFLPGSFKVRMLLSLVFKHPGAAWRMSLKPEECTDIIV